MRIETSITASFSNLGQTDRLLFHGLQDARFVLIFHRVELIDTAYAFVG